MLSTQSWLANTIREVQRLPLELLANDDDFCLKRLRDFASSLENGPDPSSRALLTVFLLGVCRRSLDLLHHLTGYAGCACRAIGWSNVEPFMSPCTDDPRQVFWTWLDAVERGYRGHRPRPSLRMAKLIRANAYQRARVCELATSVVGISARR